MLDVESGCQSLSMMDRERLKRGGELKVFSDCASRHVPQLYLDKFLIGGPSI